MIGLIGTGRLMRHALRRDRVALPVWIVGASALGAAVVAAEVAMYADASERASGAAFGAANVLSRIMDGPASGTSLGAVSMVEALMKLSIVVAFMSSQAVLRHTRQDEETGRAELIGSGIVGRQARLTAALAVSLLASVVVGAAVASVLVAQGLPWEGSLATGASLAATGALFAAVAAVAAQVSTTQRGANAIVTGTVGAAFLLRAVGDAFGTVSADGVHLVSAWPSWLSPLGWGQQMRVFDQNNWGVLAISGVSTAVLCVTAFVLGNGRDMGAGLLAARSGPATASSRLLSPAGLAWRLHRASLGAWTAAMVLSGVAFGAVATSMEDFATSNPQFAQLLQNIAPGASIGELFFALVLSFVAVAASGYTVQALLRMRTEEASGRLEPILSTSVRREQWLWSHGRIALGGTVALLVSCGAAAAVSHGLVSGDYGAAAGVLAAAIVQIPAVLALGALVVAVFGVAPSWASALSWGALTGSFVVGQFGELLKLPQAVLNLSPFTHVPAVPAVALDAAPVAALAAAVVALTWLGVMGFRRRDLSTPA